MPDAEQDEARCGPAVPGGSEFWGGFELATTAEARVEALCAADDGLYVVEPVAAAELAEHLAELEIAEHGHREHAVSGSGAAAMQGSAAETGDTTKGWEWSVSSAEQE